MHSLSLYRSISQSLQICLPPFLILSVSHCFSLSLSFCLSIGLPFPDSTTVSLMSRSAIYYLSCDNDTGEAKSEEEYHLYSLKASIPWWGVRAWWAWGWGAWRGWGRRGWVHALPLSRWPPLRAAPRLCRSPGTEVSTWKGEGERGSVSVWSCVRDGWGEGRDERVDREGSWMGRERERR